VFKYLCFGWGCFAVTVGTYRLLTNSDPFDQQGNKPFLFVGVIVLLISGTFIVLSIQESSLGRKTFQSRRSQILIRDVEYDLDKEYEVKSNGERNLSQNAPLSVNAVLTWAVENSQIDEEEIVGLNELLAAAYDQSAVEPNDLKEGTPNNMTEKNIYDEGLNQVLGSMLSPATSQGRDFWSKPEFFDLWDNYDAKTYAFFLSIETMHPAVNYRDLISASLSRRVNGDEDAFNLATEKIREALLSVAADLKKATAIGGGAQAHMHYFGTPSFQWRWVPTGYNPETDTHWVY
jgi:hypothetical protein